LLLVLNEPSTDGAAPADVDFRAGYERAAGDALGTGSDRLLIVAGYRADELPDLTQSISYLTDREVYWVTNGEGAPPVMQATLAAPGSLAHVVHARSADEFIGDLAEATGCFHHGLPERARQTGRPPGNASREQTDVDRTKTLDAPRQDNDIPAVEDLRLVFQARMATGASRQHLLAKAEKRFLTIEADHPGRGLSTLARISLLQGDLPAVQRWLTAWRESVSDSEAEQMLQSSDFDPVRDQPWFYRICNRP
jgi:hypothetical protein